jgi:hypothetical protein
VDKLSLSPLGFAPDSNPGGTGNDAAVHGAQWAAASQDSAGTTRNGAMNFSAATGGQLVIPTGAADPNGFDAQLGTIMFWMRSAAVATNSGNEGAILFDRRTSSGLVLAQHDDGTLFVQTGPASANQFSSVSSVTDGKWHQVALVYDQNDGGMVSIYVDGMLDSVNFNTGTWSWPEGQPIELGKSHDAYWRNFDDSMDDFRFYNRNLTDTEIAAAINGDLVDEASLLTRLNFDAAPVPGVSIGWLTADAVLESSDNVDGPYTSVDPAPVSPYAIKADVARKFFRYSHTAATILSNPYDM